MRSEILTHVRHGSTAARRARQDCPPLLFCGSPVLLPLRIELLGQLVILLPPLRVRRRHFRGPHRDHTLIRVAHDCQANYGQGLIEAKKSISARLVLNCTGFPSIATMMSCACRPAVCAGPSETTSARALRHLRLRTGEFEGFWIFEDHLKKHIGADGLQFYEYRFPSELEPILHSPDAISVVTTSP